MDVLETYRDTVTGLIDIHLSSVSNRLNETRHALTTMSTFFIPLTLISGVYGMNFGNNADRLLGHAGVADVFWVSLDCVADAVGMFFYPRSSVGCGLQSSLARQLLLQSSQFA